MSSNNESESLDANTIRICYLSDYAPAMKAAEEEYPEVFCGDSVFPISLAEAVRDLALNPHMKLSAGQRGLLFSASFQLAKQFGWKAVKEKKNV